MANSATLEDVRAAEVGYLVERRRLLNPGQATPSPDAVGQSLVGLALSGGGIRSSTTNLGVLQGLARMRLLRHVDYLCTVSGGGYIGGCLSALLSVNASAKKAGQNRPWRPEQHVVREPADLLFTTDWPGFPFRDEPGAWPDSGRPVVKHLRTHGSFLVTRRGFFTTESLRSIGGLVTGIAYHWLLFLLALSVVATLGLWLTLEFLAPDTASEFQAPPLAPVGLDDKESTAWARMGAILGLVGPALAAAARAKPLLWAILAGALVASALFPVVWGALLRHGWRWGEPKEGESREDAFYRRLLKWLRRISLLALGVIAVILRFVYGPEALREPLAWLFLPFALTLGFWLSGLGLYIILPWGEIAAWRGETGEAIRHLWSRQFRSAWGSVEALALYWVIGAFALALFPFITFAVRDVGPPAIITSLITALAAAGVSRGLVTRLGGVPGAKVWIPLGVKKALLGVLVTLFIAVVLVVLGVGFVSWAIGGGPSFATIMLASAVLLCLVGIVGNSNKIGLHYFYRDRLMETFLRTEATNLDGLTLDVVHDAVDMRLKELHGVADGPTPDYRRCVTTAPYLLVSAAINLAERRDLTRKDRKSGYFVFSKLYCGSYHTGFRATAKYQAGEVKLGRALTVSGAALASGMGYQTFFAQAFATTLFNLRLGYWMENPRKPPRLLRSRAERPIFSPWYLLREMLSWTHDRGRLVNLSDGGHTGDNIGIYPLLQRRCKVIIACDAEADPNLAFGSFTEGLRHAYIDMNIDVDIDLTMIRSDPMTGRSRSHCAIGRIRYPETEKEACAEGWLIYIKNSLTGDEPEPMKNYKIAHAAFPHETTLDQFFDDAQFESYRALGDHLVEHTFEPVLAAGAPFGESWLRLLQSHHTSVKAIDDPDYWRVATTLSQLEDMVTGEELRWYYEECYLPATERRTSQPATPDLALLTRVVLKQARLMEQVYLALDLGRHANAPDNRGWMNLFRNWGRSPTFQSHFARVRGTLTREFVKFYDAYLRNSPPIDDAPVPHPWDVNFPPGAPPIYLDPGRREARA